VPGEERVKGQSDSFKVSDVPALSGDFGKQDRGGPFPQLLDHHIFINCVLVGEKTPVFLQLDHLTQPRKLSVICDVSCEPESPWNPLPFYNKITTLKHPVQQITNIPTPLDLIAIDHLPTLLPKESSVEFSSQLLPHLMTLDPVMEKSAQVWIRANDLFHKHLQSLA